MHARARAHTQKLSLYYFKASKITVLPVERPGIFPGNFRFYSSYLARIYAPYTSFL